MNQLKFGVPIANAVTTGINMPSSQVRHQTGTCGIEPSKFPPPPPPPPPPSKFPEHLVRPPCMPGSEQARFPSDCHAFRSFYCPPEKDKYLYPPFSDNIDFIPSGSVECWWVKHPRCEFHDRNEGDGEVAVKI